MTAFLARIIGFVLSAIYNLVNNYGLSVILLTLLVRLLLLPLYTKQNKYSAAMNDLQPKKKYTQISKETHEKKKEETNSKNKFVKTILKIKKEKKN